MKKLILFAVAICLFNSSYSQNIEDREAPREKTEAEKKLSPKPYTGKYTSAFAKGGGIQSNECFSFVPIPEDAIQLDFTANACSGTGGLDAAHGPFPLEFDFCHFGDTYNEFTISNKGNIQFGECDFVFEPAGFPNNGLPMVAAFWADIDMSCPECGSIYYWTTPTAAYITWEAVGYWPDVSGLLNTFQIVITDQTDPIVGVGNNVGLFYQDMQWTSSNWNGGVGGFNGDAATVGANKGDGLNYVQFGRFLFDTDDYDGPFGDEDGIHWLDDKSFVFNICSTTDNIPPIPNVTDNCDTIFICQNDTYEFDVSFNAPEGAQTVTVTVDDSDADGWVETDSGDGFLQGFMEGTPDNIGTHTLIFSGTDDGTPEGITAVTYIIEVVNVELPDLVVTGDSFEDDIVSFCGGSDGAILNASDGFDSYFWGGGITGQNGVLDSPGEYTLSAFFQGCEANYGPITVLEVPFYNPDVFSEGFDVCSGQTTTLVLEEYDDYETVNWSLYIDENDNTFGEIQTPDLTAEEIEVTEGLYQVDVIDETGCPGTRLVPVGIIQVQPGVIPPTECEDNEICWSGAWADPDVCQHFIYLYDSEGDTWEGANIEAFVDGIGPLNYNISNAATFLPTGTAATHNQVITYEFTSGLDDDDIDVVIYNCEGDIVFDTTEGDVLVEGEFFSQQAETQLNAFTGQWTSSNPDGVFGCPNEFNPALGTCCYTVPDGYLGNDVLTFTADICPLELEYNVLFSTQLQMTLDETNFELCSDEGGALIQPVYFPDESIDPITYNWTPNFDCDGNPDCLIQASAAYSINAENSCGEDVELDGLVVINPSPVANLSDAFICDNEALILNPGDNPNNADCTWSDGSTGSTLNVSSGGTYSVTCVNPCGTAESSAVVTQEFTPNVELWSFDVLVCADDDVLISPNWNNGTGPFEWSMSYVDENNLTQTETLDETGNELTVSSLDFPDGVNEMVITYTLENGCGIDSESTIAYTDACFIIAPNVFSPDNDGADNGAIAGGLNEGWQVLGIEGVAGVMVKIYDRWGALVYENDSYDNNSPWKGEHSNGSELTEGVYYYTVTTPRGNKEIQGTVTLLRSK